MKTRYIIEVDALGGGTLTIESHLPDGVRRMPMALRRFAWESVREIRPAAQRDGEPWRRYDALSPMHFKISGEVEQIEPPTIETAGLISPGQAERMATIEAGLRAIADGGMVEYTGTITAIDYDESGAVRSIYSSLKPIEASSWPPEKIKGKLSKAAPNPPRGKSAKRKAVNKQRGKRG